MVGQRDHLTSLTGLVTRKISVFVTLTLLGLAAWYGVSSYMGSYQGGILWVSASQGSIEASHSTFMRQLERRATALMRVRAPDIGLADGETFIRRADDRTTQFGHRLPDAVVEQALLEAARVTNDAGSTPILTSSGQRWSDEGLTGAIYLVDGDTLGVFFSPLTDTWLEMDARVTAAEIVIADAEGRLMATTLKDTKDAVLMPAARDLPAILRQPEAAQPAHRPLHFDAPYTGSSPNRWHRGDVHFGVFSAATPLRDRAGATIGSVWVLVPQDVMLGWPRRGVLGTMALGLLFALLMAWTTRRQVSLVVEPLERMRGKIISLERHFDAREAKGAAPNLSLEDSGQSIHAEIAELDAVARGLATLERKIADNAALEEQLRKSQKMEAVGTLAGGIAHDFNNLLSVIMLNAEVLQDELEAASESGALLDPSQRELLGDLLDASEQAKLLTRQLLALSREHHVEDKSFDLNRAVADSVRMLRRLIPEAIAVVLRLHDDPLPVHGHEHTLSQIILNLIVNARDAIRGRGHIFVELTNEHVESERSCTEGALRPGPYAVLTVRDTGHGIPEERFAAVFEPFVSTKEANGTGLGLTVVRHSVLRGFGGAIALESVVDEGTTYRVYLPLARENVLFSDSVTSSAAEPIIGGRLVALVEDNPHVRKSFRRTLERIGCEVLDFPSGPEFIQWLVQTPERPVDLLITDVVMPEMSGPETYLAAREISPGIRVLFITGYAGSSFIDADLNNVPLLHKPVDRASLQAKMHEILDLT